MPDVYTLSFYMFAILTALSSVLVFLQRKLVHAVLALTMAFSMSAVLFLVLNQTFVALLQLLVFVGGLSTYLMVSLANEEKGRRYIRISFFIPIVIALSIWFAYFAQLSLHSETASGSSMDATFSVAIAQYYPLFYGIAALLFAAAFGSVLFIKKFSRLVT